MATTKQIEEFRKGFEKSGVFDKNGKSYLKHYVEQLEAIAVEWKADKDKTCDKCANKYDGLYTMECYSCKRYNVDKWRAK